MAYTVWSSLSVEEQTEILTLYNNGHTVDDLAERYSLRAVSLDRKLRSLRASTSPVLDFRSCSVEIEYPTKVMIYSDTHFGAHDDKALNAAIAVASEFGPDMIINLGDTLDAHKLSVYKKDPRALNIQEERDAWYDWAERLNNACDAQARFIIVGNHDQRYVSALLNVDGILDMPEAGVQSLLYTEQLGYEEPVDIIYVNQEGDDLFPDAMIYLMHGEFARKHSGSSVRAASEMFSGASTVVGHAHRTAMYTRRTAHGIVKGYEVGTLASLNPSYQLFPDWSQSIITGVIGPTSFDFQLHVINRGEVFFNGKRIRA